MWAGDWRRAHHFTSPEAEVEAVRTRVGLIDVSTLGKFRVRGPQAAELLERLYSGRFADQRVGRLRYGAMLNDEGVILDDGAVLRVADDEFFVTVTSGNAAALERWITWWLADWGLDVRVLNVTGAFAAMNVAGPRSRDVMRTLTDADVSADGLPYMAGARVEVAGVPAFVLRLGFVGELGYELHVPSMYGEHVWDAVMEAGRPHGIAPFGLEAQRVLRLEKQHILVGQDTDAESDPFEAGLGFMVKDGKADFLGQRALQDLASAGPGERLVGLHRAARVAPAGRRVGRPRRDLGRARDVGAAERRGRSGGRPRVDTRRLGERRDDLPDRVRPLQLARDRAPVALLRPRGREAAIVSAPIRRSPVAAMHRSNGAVVDLEAGWELPTSYGDPRSRPDASERPSPSGTSRCGEGRRARSLG